MQIALTPKQDSDNSSPPNVILSESEQGRLRIELVAPEREIFLDRQEFLRAYRALFPEDGL